MNISKIISASARPGLYEKGNAVMWTDPHISKQLLETHLNPDLDLASRRPATITQTVDWILSNTTKSKLEILDLGCGPGLYAEKFAMKGHQVTGVDFSKNSISHAMKEAKKKNLDISYLNESYLELDLEENKFDLVLLIFTDIGPLLPDERSKLLSMVKKVLKPGGMFIFDLLNDKGIESKLSPNSWEVSAEGFWKNKPYIALTESFFYPEEKVILYQHLVIDEQGHIDSYRFWNHFFSNEDVEKILLENKFENIELCNNVIPSGDMYESEDVTFCKATVT